MSRRVPRVWTRARRLGPRARAPGSPRPGAVATAREHRHRCWTTGSKPSERYDRIVGTRVPRNSCSAADWPRRDCRQKRRIGYADACGSPPQRPRSLQDAAERPHRLALGRLDAGSQPQRPAPERAQPVNPERVPQPDEVMARSGQLELCDGYRLRQREHERARARGGGVVERLGPSEGVLAQAGGLNDVTLELQVEDQPGRKGGKERADA